MNKRFIWVGNNILMDAMTSKRKLEALAFAIAIKKQFISSSYHNPNAIELSKVLQVHSKRSKRIIDDSIEFGYTRLENGKLIANKISEKGSVSFKLDVTRFNNMKVNNKYSRKNDTDKKCINLTSLTDELRKFKIHTKIEQKKFIVDTIRGGGAENISVAEIKKHQKNISRYAINTNFVEEGISLLSLMKATSIRNRNKIVALLNEMIKERTITKEKQMYKIGLCKSNTYFQSNEFGSFFEYKNNLYLVKPTIYRNNQRIAERIVKR